MCVLVVAVCDLVAALTPGGGRTAAPPPTPDSWPTAAVWAGFFAHNAALPFIAAHAALVPRVWWAGLGYERRRGAVVRVLRGENKGG